MLRSGRVDPKLAPFAVSDMKDRFAKQVGSADHGAQGNPQGGM
jgi:hypothetical protein